MPKMKIFSASERKAFELPPVFNGIERKRFFSLPLTFNELLDGLKTPTNKVYFLVTAGYFKARCRFLPGSFIKRTLNLLPRK